MKKLTKKRSIELCLELWTWLAENPGNRKRDWPEWNKYGDADSYCFACEYVRQHRSILQTEWSCKKCPLIALWGEHKGNDPCTQNEESPYYLWVESGCGDTKSAKKIATYCRKLLKNMEKK